MRNADPKSRKASEDDAALVERLIAGDQAAFASLIERYHGSLVRVAMLFVADHATAQEVAQETWIGVLNGISEFEKRSSLKTWIFRILTNRAKTRGVREGRSIPFSALGTDENEPAVDPGRFDAKNMWSDPPVMWNEDTPEKLLLRREAVACMEKALAELPAQQRAVVTLRDVEELDADEVCQLLEISEGNQRVLLHRARAKIRRALERLLGKE